MLVQVDGTWGVVCDDAWDTTDGDVVCKQLFGSGSYALSAPCCSSFGWDSDYDFVMDDVACSGSESNLQACSYLSTHNCGSTEGAGVVCAPVPDPTPQPSAQPTTTQPTGAPSMIPTPAPSADVGNTIFHGQLGSGYVFGSLDADAASTAYWNSEYFRCVDIP